MSVFEAFSIVIVAVGVVELVNYMLSGKGS